MFARAPPPPISQDFKFRPFDRALSNAVSDLDIGHVHRSPRHRGRRASPPRRFVRPGCSAGNWTAAGDGCWLGCVVWGPDGVGRSARSAPRCFFFWNDLVWSAAIGLVLAALAPALPNLIAQTATSGPPTSSMARSATLKRIPASSIMFIVPYAIVTAALSHLAGSSPPAPRPCMHGHHGGLGHPGTGRD